MQHNPRLHLSKIWTCSADRAQGNAASAVEAAAHAHSAGGSATSADRPAAEEPCNAEGCQ